MSRIIDIKANGKTATQAVDERRLRLGAHLREFVEGRKSAAGLKALVVAQFADGQPGRLEMEAHLRRRGGLVEIWLTDAGESRMCGSVAESEASAQDLVLRAFQLISWAIDRNFEWVSAGLPIARWQVAGLLAIEAETAPQLRIVGGRG
jgi:hypothetical protein